MPEKTDTRQARAERQAKALRENLKRRKAQSRGRQAHGGEGRAADPVQNPKKGGETAS